MYILFLCEQCRTRSRNRNYTIMNFPCFYPGVYSFNDREEYHQHFRLEKYISVRAPPFFEKILEINVLGLSVKKILQGYVDTLKLFCSHTNFSTINRDCGIFGAHKNALLPIFAKFNSS